MDSDLYGSLLAAAFEQLRVYQRKMFKAAPPDPQTVPVPDDLGSEHGEDEPEGKAAPDEVQGDVQDQE
eukprot:3806507-Amphidinium_carterae.1